MSQADLVLESLNDLSYSRVELGPIESSDDLIGLLKNNLLEFSKIVSYLTRHLSILSKYDEFVNPVESSSDESSFNLEICSFLKELACPFTSLTHGPIDERFKSVESKLELLEFLSSELQAARIIDSTKPQSGTVQAVPALNNSESEEAKALKAILIALGFPKPPANITPKEIWSKIELRVTQILSSLPKDYLGKPLLNFQLSEEEWSQLSEINKLLCEDFRMRRELLLTRLDVTVQSFKWADRLKKSNSEIAAIYHEKRRELTIKQSVKLSDLLAARDDLCTEERTCSSRLMTKSQLHKIIIPKVPDRGGRTGELEPPPPEMPMFKQRQSQPQNQRQYHGGGGGRGGHDNAPRWDNQQQQQQQQQYRPQSDLEKFQNPDYGQQQNSRESSGRGGRGGRGGGHRGGGRGNRY